MRVTATTGSSMAAHAASPTRALDPFPDGWPEGDRHSSSPGPSLSPTPILPWLFVPVPCYPHQVFGKNGVFKRNVYSMHMEPSGDTGELVLGGLHKVSLDP